MVASIATGLVSVTSRASMTVLVIGGVVRTPEVGTNNVQILKDFLVFVLNMFFFLFTFF